MIQMSLASVLALLIKNWIYYVWMYTLDEITIYTCPFHAAKVFNAVHHACEHVLVCTLWIFSVQHAAICASAYKGLSGKSISRHLGWGFDREWLLKCCELKIWSFSLTFCKKNKENSKQMKMASVSCVFIQSPNWEHCKTAKQPNSHAVNEVHLYRKCSHSKMCFLCY